MKKQIIECPFCEHGELVPEIRNQEKSCDGYSQIVCIEYSLCSSCGAETLTEEQSKNNKKSMLAFYKKSKGLLTSDEIKHFRRINDLTQIQASEILGGGVNAFAKYETGSVTQSTPMDKLLRVCLHFPEVVEFLRVLNSRVRTISTRPINNTQDSILSVYSYGNEQTGHVTSLANPHKTLARNYWVSSTYSE